MWTSSSIPSRSNRPQGVECMDPLFLPGRLGVMKNVVGEVEVVLVR